MRGFIILILGVFFITINTIAQHTYNIVTSGFDSVVAKQWESIGGGNGAVNLTNGLCSDLHSNAFVVGEVFHSMSLEGESLPFGLYSVKYDSSGVFQWANAMTGGTMQVNSVIADSHGNSYVLGRFSQRIQSNGMVLNSSSSWDIFICKYDRDGNVIWLKSILDYNHWVEVGDIAINEEYNHLYIIGTEDLTFPTWNDSKLFVAKLSLETGNVIKKIEIGENSGTPLAYSNMGYGITNNESFVYITGSIKNDAGYSDIYIAKLDSSLLVVWDAQYGDNNNQNVGYDIALDDSENIYVTGQYSNVTHIDTFTLFSNDRADLFLLKLNEAGNVQWVSSAGSSITDSQGKDFGFKVEVDLNSDVYLTGYVGENASFSDEIMTTNQGPFIAKYKNDGSLNFAKSFFTGYDNVYKRGTGHIAIGKNNGLIFGTNFLHNIELCDSLTKTDSVSATNSPHRTSEITVYPNPNHGLFTIGGIKIDQNVDILIYDYLGRVIRATTNVYSMSPDKMNMDLSTLIPGTYYLLIYTHTGVTSRKIQIFE